MTWTYGGDPSANDRDEVRFLCGDTDTSDQLVTDEEIAYAIADAGSNYLAAAVICEALAAEFARDVDTTNGPASEKESQRYQQYKDRAYALKAKANALVKPVFGGQSISDKNTLGSDSDVPQPYFRRGMSDASNAMTHLDGGGEDDDRLS